MEKELNSYLLHIYTMELKELPPDDIIQSFIQNDEDDIFRVIKNSMFPSNFSLSYDALKLWISNFIDSIIKLTSYSFTDIDRELYIYYLYYTIIQGKISPDFFNIDKLIEHIEDLLGPTFHKGTNDWYLQEQLRLILLHILNLNEDIFLKHIDKIKIHLFIAKKNINAIKDFQNRKER